jgi:16S rRNA (cytosine967-C5)-methyltransferase
VNFPLTDRPDPRRLSVWVLGRVFGTDGYADRILEGAFRRYGLDARDRALCTELVFGTLRWWKRINRILENGYRGEWNRVPEAVRRICEMALYQILFLSKVPSYAAVDEAVSLGGEILNGRWKSTINALLRNTVRNGARDLMLSGLDPAAALSVSGSHPQWLVENWIGRFGIERAERICAADNERPAIGLRVNRLRAEPGAVLSELLERGVEAEPCPWLDEFLLVRKTGSIPELAAFREGRVTVQDPSAGLAGRLVDPKPGESILDLAAAPGGKTTHLAELAGDAGRIVAADVHVRRLGLVGQNVRRLGLRSVTAVVTNGGSALTAAFDKVLLDAPCSGMGTLRRRPELKWRRRPEDIAKLAAVQRGLLEDADRTLRPGGVLVYSTCTVTEEENRGVVDGFLRDHPGYRMEPAGNWLPAGVTADGCAETWPDLHGTDGAFAARLIKPE